MFSRGYGVLCHLSMLPNSYGIGEMGEEVDSFIKWMSSCGMKYWEVLPINSLLGRTGDGALTPYGATSCFAGNILYISPERLKKDHLLSTNFKRKKNPTSLVDDFERLDEEKTTILWQAFEFCGARVLKSKEFQQFQKDNRDWLENYALFEVLVRFKFNHFFWQEWPGPFRDKDQKAMSTVQKDFKREITWVKFCQFLFFKQWNRVRQLASNAGIQIIGDIPIYSGRHSADVWANRKQFKVDRLGHATHNGGTPPDCFSSTGQNWRSPVYHWAQAKKDQFYWQRKRIGHQLKLFDILRLDHYQGLISFWSIPAKGESKDGKWMPIPSRELFSWLQKDQKGKGLPVIVEDLGALTDKARKIMKDFGLWGMNVLLYGFDSPDSTYLPYKYIPQSVCYIGTHDNNTASGHWKLASKDEKELFSKYRGKSIREMEKGGIHLEYIHLALSTSSQMVILQIQDLLALPEKSRTNDPISYVNQRDIRLNWSYRFVDYKELKKMSQDLRDTARSFGR